VEDLTPEQLEAILGTDYETVLADLLRQKGSAEERRFDKKPVGQLPSGRVAFDPGTVIANTMNRRRAEKEASAAQTKMDEVLGQQKEGRRAFAQALGGPRPQAPAGAPRSVDSTIPGQMPPQAPPAPVPGAPQMATGAPPPMANAAQMPPDRLQRAGVPPEVQALLAKLRGR
jgi:hypothetical protein